MIINLCKIGVGTALRNIVVVANLLHGLKKFLTDSITGSSSETPSFAKRRYSIGVRFRNGNGLIILSALIAVTVVVAVLVNGITEKTSKRYAQFYSMETVEKFDLYLSREIDLVSKIDRSKELIKWFADENSTHKKTAAYEKITGYADMMFGNEFYFGIEGSLN